MTMAALVMVHVVPMMVAAADKVLHGGSLLLLLGDLLVFVVELN